MVQSVEQVAQLLQRHRDRQYTLTSSGGIRPKRLLDSLRGPNSRSQEQPEVEVPQQTWD
jgi:hypothetical protein